MGVFDKWYCVVFQFQVDREIGFLDESSYVAFQRLKQEMRDRYRGKDANVNVEIVSVFLSNTNTTSSRYHDNYKS